MTTNRSILDRNLADIRDDILRMGSAVETMLEKSVRALRDKDVLLAREVKAEEKVVDKMRYEVEERSVETIAMQMPFAGDLRAIIACTHMAVELERMADYANGIAKIVIRLEDTPLLPRPISLAEMQRVCCAMLRKSLEAFARRDLKLAQDVEAMDDELDDLYKGVVRDLVTWMAEHSDSIHRAQQLMWVAHNLERAGDRVGNLCERITYAITGTLHEEQSSREDNDVEAGDAV
jgi:phosphate transport system protein